MTRIVFINLHANPMLVKTLEKFIFKQSSAVKHRYFLDYLLRSEDVQVCTYINKRGFSLSTSAPDIILDFLNLFRFLENRITLKKNGINPTSVKVLRKPSEIRQDDIVIAYRHCMASLYKLEDVRAFKAISMIHFWGKRLESARLQEINPDVLFSESDLRKHSEIFQAYYGWYENDFIIHPFVFADRFKRMVPFSKRKNMAFATGTITYKNDADFLEIYHDPCDQPARKQIKDNPDLLSGIVYCTSQDYTENNNLNTKIKVPRFLKALHYKLFETQQKSYYSFDMVEQFNNYKMCIVGEEVLGVPGIGFVEGMACGCAYIGQKKGYYEDYGMKDGVHYIGYDGTLTDLVNKIRYYQAPEHQEELEMIANNGYEFAQTHFNGPDVAEQLLEGLKNAHKKWLNNAEK